MHIYNWHKQIVFQKMLQQSQSSSQQSDNTLRVAPLISDHKLSQLYVKTVGTLMGLPILNNNIKITQHMQSQQYCECNIINIIIYILLPCIVVIPPLVITDTKLYPLACLIPTVVLPIIHFILRCVRKQTHNFMNYVSLLLYGFLWGTHLFAVSQLLAVNSLQQMQHDININICTIVLSVISITISVSTIVIAPVQQFSTTSTQYETYQYNSTFGMRFIVLVPMLSATTIMYIFYLTNSSSPGEVGINSLYMFRMVILYLGLGTSILGLFAIIGWVSTFQHMLMFVTNTLANRLFFNDQRYASTPIVLLAFASNLLAVILISVFHQGVFEITMISIAYWAAWGFSMLIAIALKLQQCCRPSNQLTINKNSSKRFILCIILQMVISVVLYIIFYFAIYPQRQLITSSKRVAVIIVGINIGLYVLFQIFNQMRAARSILGCIGCISFTAGTHSTLDLIQRFILRFTSSLSILSVVSVVLFERVSQANAPNYLVAQQYFISQILNPILVYRTFKKCLSFPRSHSTHIPLTIYFILIQIEHISTDIPMQIVLYFPLLPDNFYNILAVPFLIPKKLKHRKQHLYKIGYFISAIISVILMIGTLGLAQYTMVFGLPVFWCVIPKHRQSSIQNQENKEQTRQQNNSYSPQYTLYRKIISELGPQIFRGKKPGNYILRVSKYLIFVQICNQCYGLFQIINFVGLQAQQTTTCHAKQGQTIDRIISEVWDQNQNNKIKCKISDRIFNAIWPIQSVNSIMISAQNQIKFTGIIEAQDFYKLFKNTLIKSLIYFYAKMIKQHGQKLYDSFQNQAQQMIEDLHLVMNRQKCDQIFSYEFAKSVNLQARYPNTSNVNVGRKKLPPLNNPKKQQAGKKQKVIDDFMDLLEPSENSTHHINVKNKQSEQQQKKQVLKQITFSPKQATQNKSMQMSALKMASIEQCHMAVILTLYSGIIGKVNYLNIEKIYKILNRQPDVLQQISFQKKVQISAAAVGASLKISIGKYLEESTEVGIDDFDYYIKNQFLGTLQSPGFSQAVSECRQDVWTVYYAPIKKLLTVKRISSIQTPMYILGMDSHIVKSIWNNLRFELLYAANDDDQRYSIQTHQYLMRNLLVQACEEPFGYAGIYAQNIYSY